MVRLLLSTILVLTTIAAIFVAISMIVPACGLRLPLFGTVFGGVNCQPIVGDDSNAKVAHLRAEIAQLETKLKNLSCISLGSRPKGTKLVPLPPLPSKTVIPSLEPEVAEGLPSLPSPENRSTLPSQPSQPAVEDESPEANPADQYCSTSPEDIELVTVIDGSLSMKRPLSLDPAREKGLVLAEMRGSEPARKELQRLRQSTLPDRIGAVKSSISRLMERLPLKKRRSIFFAGCGQIETVSGSKVIERLKALRPKGDTPLSESVWRGAQILGDRSGQVLVVTDGNDTCGGDVCQIANRIASLPATIRVDVIDLSGWTDVRCLASRTGGRYRRLQPGQTLDNLVENLGSSRVCRPGELP